MNENYVRITGEMTQDASQRGDNGPLVLNIEHRGETFERRDGTEGQNKMFMNCICWGQLREEYEHLQEGDRVTIEGALEWNSYVNKDGERKGSLQMVITHVTQESGAEVPTRPEPAPPTPSPVTDDDLPF